MRITLLVLAILIPGLARADEPVSVPFELLKTQHMTVQVKINGKGPYRLIFDTGAPITLINNRVAKEAGVFPKGFVQPPFALFGSVGQFAIKDMEVGDLKVKNMKTMVMDHPTVEAISKALGPIEGIVGMSFFGKYRMTLDYQAKTMTFVPVNYEPPDMIQAVMKMVLGGGKSEKKVVAPAGLLGIQVEKSADEKAGVTVKEVLEDSPAARAGLKAGDRLVTLDNRWTDSVLDCYKAAARLEPGSTVAAELRRDGKEIAVRITVPPGF